MGWKYIVLRAANREIPFIFPDTFTHSVMVDVIKHHMVIDAQAVANGNLSDAAIEKLKDGIKPVSAGEVTAIEAICAGRSETLQLSSRGIVDTILIGGYSYFHGILVEDDDDG